MYISEYFSSRNEVQTVVIIDAISKLRADIPRQKCQMSSQGTFLISFISFRKQQINKSGYPDLSKLKKKSGRPLTHFHFLPEEGEKKELKKVDIVVSYKVVKTALERKIKTET